MLPGEPNDLSVEYHNAATAKGVLPLEGIVVVAVEQAVAAPLCSRHLADLGANVTKIERPDGGDFARRYDSVVRGLSSYFVWLNAGKKSVVLDLKDRADRVVLDELLAKADVLLHNLGPGAAERLGLGWDVVHERWPKLISCSITGYGSDGPYRDSKAFDLLLQGEAALMSVTGTPTEPARVGISIADISAGMYALSAILAALVRRDRTGEASFVEISMLDCLAEWMSVPLLFQRYGLGAPPRTGTRHSTIVPYGPYRCGDGRLVNLAVQNEGQWQRLCIQVLGRADLVDHARFSTNELRVQHRAALEPLIEQILGAVPSGAVIARLRVADVPHGSVNEVSDLLGHAQLQARRRWVTVATPAGNVATLRPPFDSPATVPDRMRRVPALDEDGAAIRARRD